MPAKKKKENGGSIEFIIKIPDRSKAREDLETMVVLFGTFLEALPSVLKSNDLGKELKRGKDERDS